MEHRRSLIVGTTITLCIGMAVIVLPGLAERRARAQAPSASKIRDTLPRGSLDDAGEQLARIAAHVKPAVVHIESRRDNHRGGTVEETGSGMIMRSVHTSQFFVVTNRHVILGAVPKRIQIKLYDGRIITPIKVIEDAPTDVAVLLLSETQLGYAGWGDSDNLDIGHMVLAMGSPFGLSQSVTLGIISAKGRRSLLLGEKGDDVINQDFLQTDAAINPGNSGGPLIDLQGRVVGINTAIASQGGGNEGIGFSIPSILAQHVVDQLLEHGRVQRAFLGVRLDEEFDTVAAQRLNLTRAQGARVVQIYSDTPAELAGLQIDDVVLAFDGQEIEDQSHLIHLVSLTPVNKIVRMKVLRAGTTVMVDVRLTERRASATSQNSPSNPIRINEFNERRVRPSGLTVLQLNDTLATQIGTRPGTVGVVVMQCHTTGPSAANDGLQLYDVITEAGRQPIRDTSDLSTAMDEAPGPLLLKVVRTVDGTLQSRLILWTPPQSVDD